MKWFKDKLWLMLILSFGLNIFLFRAYLKNDCRNVITDLEIKLQNTLAEKMKLKKINNDLYEKFVEVSGDKRNLISELKDIKLDLINSQKLVVNLRDQVVNLKLKENEIEAKSDSNDVVFEISYDKGYIHLDGNLDVFFSRQISSKFIKDNIIKSKVSLVLKQDPFQIITNLVKEKEGIKSYIKLNRITENGIVESDDWLSANETKFNSELFQCKENKNVSVGFVYSPIAGGLYIGFNHWDIGYINTFGDGQGSYMVGYRVELKNLFNKNIGKLMF